MGRLIICFAAIVVAFTAYNAKAENIIYGSTPTGPQPFVVNNGGQASISLLAGEDQTNGVMKVEQQYSYKNIPHADTQVKASAGFLHTLTCSSDAAATAGTIEVRDATAAGAGTVVQLLTYTTNNYPPATLTFDMVFPTGIYIDYTNAGDVDCSASFR